MKSTVTLLIILTISLSTCHRIKISQYPNGESIEVSGPGYTGYLFDRRWTEPLMSAKTEAKFKAYWWLSRCEIPIIEECLKEYVSEHLDNSVRDSLDHYLRQYFPYINQDGKQMIHITLSELYKDDSLNEELKESLKTRYRSFFGGSEDGFYVVRLDYSSWRASRE